MNGQPMRQALVYLGVALVIATAVVIYCMFFVWVPVVLMQSGSRSEQRYFAAIRESGIRIDGISSLGINELKVRWFQAGRAVTLAAEIDPTGKKIVRTYPHYPDVKANSDWMPRDPEKRL